MEKGNKPTIVSTPGTPPPEVRLDPLVDQAFRELFAGPDWARFSIHAYRFFDSHQGDHAAHTRFFERFTPYWRALCESGNLRAGADIWGKALDLAWNWEEKTTSRVHKGTPLYFSGGTALLLGEVDQGFLLIHEALQEDVDWESRGGGSSTSLPAWFFVTLRDEEVHNFWRPLVRDLAEFLETCLLEYNRECLGSLTVSDFKSKFLYDSAHRDATFFFVYSLYKAKWLVDRSRRVMDNVFATLLQLDVALNFYVVLEQLLKAQYPAKQQMHNLIVAFSQTHGLGVHECPEGEKTSRIQLVRNRFKVNPNATISAALSGGFPGFSGVQASLAIAPQMRNAAAHGIESHQALKGHFDRLTQVALNAVFAAVQHGARSSAVSGAD